MTQTTSATHAFLAREAMTLVAPDVLLRPLTGSGLHVSACYHLERDQTELVVASDEDLASWKVCSWCQAELDGAGRHYFDDLERALESYAPLPVRSRIRELAAGVAHDAVWTTNSRSYVALGLDGASVAYFGKTYWVHEQVLVELPGYDARGQGRSAGAYEREGVTCERCWLTKPVAGDCDNC